MFEHVHNKCIRVYVSLQTHTRTHTPVMDGYSAGLDEATVRVRVCACVCVCSSGNVSNEAGPCGRRPATTTLAIGSSTLAAPAEMQKVRCGVCVSAAMRRKHAVLGAACNTNWVVGPCDTQSQLIIGDYFRLQHE